MTTTESLDELESRVTAKWAAAAADRIQGFSDIFDPSAWNTVVDMGADAPSPTMQFPREQWVSYPAKRTVALILADRMLDLDSITDEQWMQVSFIVQYAGKERVA